ncbi:MAG: hypothetical protein KDC92_14110 [Bacteroidetes bacterium]|nr:hypothetical protein [Bacteroidota bacterium]
MNSKTLVQLSFGLNAVLLICLATGFSKQTNKPKVVIEHELYNNIYFKARNRIHVAVEGISNQNIVVHSPQKFVQITSLGNGEYEVFPTELSSMGCVLEIYQLQTKDSVLVHSRHFDIMRLPDPYLFVGTGGHFSSPLEDFIKGKFHVTADYGHANLKINYNIKKFNLAIEPIKGENYTYVSKSHKPTLEMNDAIRKLHRGDKVIIRDTEVISNISDELIVLGPFEMEVQ